MELIDIGRQYRLHKREIDAAIQRVLDHGRFIMGPEIQALEEALAAYVGARHCVSCANGTDALLMALMALDVGPGDEVVTVPFTWIATAEVARVIGAEVRFVDIEPIGFTLDPERLEAAITPRTKAIIPVGLFGQMPDLERIGEIAARHAVPVIEDGAQSFGATRNGRRSCGATVIGCTSFFPSKPLGCYGDGGAIFTSDDALASRLRAIRTHGGEKRGHHTCVGLNGRLDTLQAAVLLAKWPHYDAEVAARQRVADRYGQALIDVCRAPRLLPGNTSVWAQYTLRLRDRDQVQARLKAEGVPTAVYYPNCLHEQPVFARYGHRLDAFPESVAASREVLSLPMHPWLEDAEQDRVVAAVRRAVAGSASAARS